MFRQESHQRTGQRGKLELPLETRSPLESPKPFCFGAAEGFGFNKKDRESRKTLPVVYLILVTIFGTRASRTETTAVQMISGII